MAVGAWTIYNIWNREKKHMRPVLNELERLISPCTSYPLPSNNSAKYDPSCPVIPVIRAFFVTFFPPFLVIKATVSLFNNTLVYKNQLRNRLFSDATTLLKSARKNQVRRLVEVKLR